MPRFNSVATATRLSSSVQVDGRLAVRELHEADTGEYELRDYLTAGNADLDQMLEDNAMQFLERLATK